MLLAPFERVGRLVMDLGLSGVIEKFEEHWGRRATKLLLAIIGLAVISICLGAIWSTLIRPLVLMVERMLPNHPATPQVRAIATVAVLAAWLVMGLNIGLSYLDQFVNWKLNARLLSQTREAKALVTETGENLAAAEASLANARAIVADAEQSLDRVFTYALDHGMLNEAQIDELKSTL